MSDGIDWNNQVTQAASKLSVSDTVKLLDPMFAALIKDGWDKDMIIAIILDASNNVIGRNVLSLLYDRYVEKTRSEQ